MRLVVLGWGNESRGDDALGPLLLRHIAAFAPDVEIAEDYQLQIEHALDLLGFDAALFVDASREGPAPFSFRETGPVASRALSTHALAPEAVLDVYVQITGKAPPPAFVLGLRGVSFGLGESLSETGAAALAAACRFIERLLTERSLVDWRRLSEAGETPQLALAGSGAAL